MFFRDIATNDTLRRLFIKSHKIGWPLVTAAEIESAEMYFKKRRHIYGLHTMGCLGSSAAYAGSLIGTEVTRSYDCISYYQIDLKWVLGMAAAGAGTAYGLNYLLYPNDVKVEALRHGIIAFDNNNMPITEQEAESLFVDKRFDWGFAGCMTLGCLSSAATPMALLYPWALMSPETNMDCLLTILPIVAVSGAEFNMLLKMSKDYARKRDRQAAIERIKKKREEKRIQR